MPCSAGGEYTQERCQEGPDCPVRAGRACFRYCEPGSADRRTRILGNPHEDFAHPILDIATNHHLTPLYSGGASFVCIWQDATRKNADCISLIREFVNDGQELLADFIGTCCRDHFEQYILI